MMSDIMKCHAFSAARGQEHRWQVALPGNRGAYTHFRCGHCPTCGTHLSADGTETPMVQAVPADDVREAAEAVRAFVVWYEKHYGFYGDATPETFEAVCNAALSAAGATPVPDVEALPTDTELLNALGRACQAGCSTYPGRLSLIFKSSHPGGDFVDLRDFAKHILAEAGQGQGAPDEGAGQ